MNWKRLAAYILGGGTLAGSPFALVQSGLLDFSSPAPAAQEVRYEEPEKALLQSDEEEIDMDSAWRASQESQRYSGRKPAGERVGCICMDNERLHITGGGACSGHGGVRFWLYAQSDGSIIQHPTARHRAHPYELSSEELSKLRSQQKKKDEKWIGNFGPYELLFSLAFCIVLAYFIQSLFNKTKDD